jgi:hypothetical protein
MLKTQQLRHSDKNPSLKNKQVIFEASPGALSAPMHEEILQVYHNIFTF